MYIMLVFCLCSAFDLKAHAADVYQIVESAEGLTGTCNGTEMKNVYVSVKESNATYQVVKPCTSSSKVYYFNEAGIGNLCSDSKFVKITYNNSSKSYYSNKGTLEKNKIVGNKKAGYY